MVIVLYHWWQYQKHNYVRKDHFNLHDQIFIMMMMSYSEAKKLVDCHHHYPKEKQRKKKEMIRIFFPTKFQIDPTLIMIENKTIPTL
mgnify:CR=1 FL=1